MSSQHHSPNSPGRIDANEVMAKLDIDRESGLLAHQIRGTADVVYGASDNIPGGVVAVYRDGRRVEGIFRDGIFIASHGDMSDAGRGPDF